ncbi:MAG: acylneuraminate cytidylyltransferase family protein [Rhodobacteraceae bacterium]|nr:acylneuraminate cytidylyltransferase family protein [Paracoccaceae bacterium]MCF8521051.1 acylneuraminate cytidylyltransferase family protein [Paracoccaceae bacterium]
MTRICTICARGGSKGVPGKNIRLIAGKPLIAWTVEQARASGLFDLIAVSSDSEAILAAAMAAGAGLAVQRPAEMATDTAGKIPVIAHALRAAEAHLGHKARILVDLDATSPLRDLADITGAVKLLEATGATNVITGAPARRSPYCNLVERQEDGYVVLSKPLPAQVLRRQDAPACFDMNASIYVWQREAFVSDPRVFYPDTQLFEMPEDRSIDIDSPLDLLRVELLLAAKQKDRP